MDTMKSKLKDCLPDDCCAKVSTSESTKLSNIMENEKDIEEIAMETFASNDNSISSTPQNSRQSSATASRRSSSTLAWTATKSKPPSAVSRGVTMTPVVAFNPRTEAEIYDTAGSSAASKHGNLADVTLVQPMQKGSRYALVQQHY